MSRYTYDELNTWPVPDAPYNPAQDYELAVSALSGLLEDGTVDTDWFLNVEYHVVRLRDGWAA